MNKILIIDNSYPINTRNHRIINTLKTNDFITKFATWNRDDKKIEKEDKSNYIFSSNIGYKSKLKKLIGLKSYYMFLKKSIESFKPDLIIASHWDNLFLSIFLKPKYTNLIYDVIDLPTSSNILILKTLKLIENFSIKKTDGIIFSSRFSKKLYVEYNKNKLLLENLPLKNNYLEKSSQEELLFKKDKFIISYIGVIRYFDILDNLIKAFKETSNDKMNLFLHGSGPDYKKIKKLYDKNNDIKITGRYEYNDIDELYFSSDVIWAAYPNKEYNVKYAISNKFFESILFEKPLIVSNKTKLGDFVMKNGLGYTVNPYNIKEIKTLLKSLPYKDLDKIKENMRRYKKERPIFWENNQKKLIEFINKILEDSNV